MRWCRAKIAAAMAVSALSVAAQPARGAADSGALMETVVKGLEDRDHALSEFHALMVCRSWITDTQIKAHRKSWGADELAGPPPPLQNGALYLLDIHYHGDQWSMDAAAMVADGMGGLFGFLDNPSAGNRSKSVEHPGYGAPVVRALCDGEKVVRWQPEANRAEVRRLRSPRQGRSVIDLPLSEMLLWVPGGPPGETFRSDPPDFVEGPVELDGRQCYRIVRAADRTEDYGPWRDEVWVAPDLGFSIVRRSRLFLERGTTDTGGRLEVRATQFKEVADGIWWPTETVVEYFGYVKGMDPPWRYTRVYQVRDVVVRGGESVRELNVQVGPGTAPGDPPFGVRFPLGTMVWERDEMGRPVGRIGQYIVGVGETTRIDLWEFIEKFHQWTPPPVDEMLNRSLVRADVEALMADVARARGDE